MRHNADLTPKQLEVTKLLAVGKTANEIAQILGISKKGVEMHTMLIFAKTECPNRVALAHWAIANKLVELLY